MTDDIIWQADQHTLAKHRILKRYLEAWAPILLQRGLNHGVLYIDGFAGPGEYIGKEPGSPIIAMESLVNHVLRSNFRGRIVFYFIEQMEERAKHLEDLIAKKYQTLPSEISYKVVKGEFNQELRKLLDGAKERDKNLLPCFCFVDPFGWKELDYDLLARIMEHPKAELFITFMAGFLNRFRESEPHEESLIRLFSPDQLTKINSKALEAEERQKLILRFFVENLKEHINQFTKEKIYDFSFSTRNDSNNLEYYLVHLTKSCKGKEVMKEAMFNLKKDGKYTFSDFDFDPLQSTLITYFEEDLWVDEAASDVFAFFKNLFGRKYADFSINKLPVNIVKERITCDTKWIYRAKILANLEKKGKISYLSSHNPRRRTGQFPEPGYIVFHF